MTDSTDAVLIERHDPGVLVTFNRPETMNALERDERRLHGCTPPRRYRRLDPGRRGHRSGRALQLTSKARASATPTRNVLFRSAGPVPSLGLPEACHRSDQWPRRRDRPDDDPAVRHPHCGHRRQARHRAEPPWGASRCPCPLDPPPAHRPQPGDRFAALRPPVHRCGRGRMGPGQRGTARCGGAPTSLRWRRRSPFTPLPCRSAYRNDSCGARTEPTRSTPGTKLHLHLMGTVDAREGVQAFMEKRDPEWSLSATEDWPTWLDER